MQRLRLPRLDQVAVKGRLLGTPPVLSLAPPGQRRQPQVFEARPLPSPLRHVVASPRRRIGWPFLLARHLLFQNQEASSFSSRRLGLP